LALAASSHPRSAEDRLTELYAVALEAHAGFASKVFELADLPAAEIYEVDTQETLGDHSGRLDLRVRGLDAKRGLVSLLYAEHKEPGGVWQDDQPKKYLPELRNQMRRTGAQGRFLVVVGSREEAGNHIPRRARASAREDAATTSEEVARITHRGSELVIAKTWQDIAICAELAGRASLTRENPLGWREAAARHDAPAAQRILRELLWYFEEEGYAVTNGLTREQLAIAPQALEIEDTLQALLDETTARLVKDKIGRFQLKTRRNGRTIQGDDFTPPPGSWIDKWRGGLSFVYSSDAKPGRGVARGQLEFQVGAWLLPKPARLLDENKPFKDQVEASHLRFELDDDGGWIFATREARAFVTGDATETLEDQADRIAAWALPNLAAILNLKPGTAHQ
jgi:hypothetical protein